MTGIVNGTTNFILTEMSRGGLSYEEALARAQALGYAEADPTEDVGGADAAAKMAILSSIAFHSRVRIDDVPYEGIDRLQAEDLGHAAALGFVVKLLGVARLHERLGRACACTRRWCPAATGWRRSTAPTTRCCSSRARPARSCWSAPAPAATRRPRRWWPTCSRSSAPTRGSFLHNALADAGRAIAPPGEVPSAFYLRMSVADRPGVLARVATIFADEELSIRTVVQSGSGDEARLVLVLHSGPEARMRRRPSRGCAALDDVRGEPVMLRVLGSGEGGRAPVTALIERYRDLLPVGPETPIVSLGEGDTPLVPLPRLSERLGVRGATPSSRA